MRLFPRFLAVAMLLTFVGTALAADYSLVRMHFDGRDGQAYLSAHPELDVATVKATLSADIVATPKTMDILRSSGFRLEVVHEDLVAHYASKVQRRDTNFGGWHTYSENIAYLDSLHTEYPTLISEKWAIGQSHEMRNIWAVRLSDNAGTDETGEPEILLDTMHHAREIMSGEFGILFADYLCANYGTDPVVTWLMDNRELYLVSIVNPDGVVYNETIEPNGGGMWRKNRRYNGPGSYGVDPNRNYPFEWVGPGSSTDPDSDLYRGPSAGSEPEVQALMNFINSREFVTHQSLHTYSNLTLYPWGYTTADTPDHDTFVHMATIMAQYNGYEIGSAPDLLYEVNGSTTDWAYADGEGHERIFTFCNEIGTSGFWPGFDERDALFADNIWPMTYLMMAAGAFPHIDDAVATDVDGGLLEPGEAGLLGFTLANMGVTESLSGAEILISHDDPYIQFDETSRTVGSLAPMGEIAVDGIAFNVSPACPDGHRMVFTAAVGDLSYKLAFLVGSPSAIFFDDFSSGTDGWSFSGGSWGLSSTAHSAPSSLTDSPSGEYGNQQDAYATIDGSFVASELVFWHRYDIEDGYDYGRVEISVDGGAWQGIQSYDGTQNAWQEVSIDLDPYTNGSPVQVRFHLDTDYSVTEDGWYIDDVMLLGASSENALPPTPALLAPSDGAVIDGAPQLTVANVTDPDGDDVSYGFRVFGDAALTQLVVSMDNVPAGDGGETSWTASLGLGTYHWRAYAADATEWGSLGETRSFTVGTATGVDGVVIGLPRLSVLGTGGSQAELQLSLPQSADVSVKIYNARGALVRDLFSGRVGSGERSLVWDGRDGSGRPAASGAYFVRATTGSNVLTGRVLMVR